MATSRARICDRPLTATEFRELMADVGPFETRPEIAVGVSGGPDSMALILLAAEWARGRGGSAFALTVDHGLRSDSAAEARQVATWLQARGIPHHILRWPGPPPSHGIQAKAREARYRLMEAWCRNNGVLHLLVAHHREDQAETHILRKSRSSGVDGLAAMPAIREVRWVRILRPLLQVPRTRLVATLAARDQSSIDDPSNRDTRFDRARIRAAMAARDDGGRQTEARLARRHGTKRVRRDRETATLLARIARPDPAGFCTILQEPLMRAPRQVGQRALARVLMCVGGGTYPPRREALGRLYTHFRSGKPAARTLGGCIVTSRSGRLVITREAAKIPRQTWSQDNVGTFWDDRFRLCGPAGMTLPRVLPLGRDGLSRLSAPQRAAVKRRTPPEARASLIAFDGPDCGIWLPHMIDGPKHAGPDIVPRPIPVFWPSQPLAGAPFAVV